MSRAYTSPPRSGSSSVLRVAVTFRDRSGADGPVSRHRAGKSRRTGSERPTVSEADPATIKKAVRWTAKQESERGANTNTYGVLERTLLQNPRIDTIYLLSDGIPEWGDVISSEGLLVAVRNWNRYRRVTINTFAITHMSLSPGKYKRTGSMERAATFMKELAHASGGKFRFIARPPK